VFTSKNNQYIRGLRDAAPIFLGYYTTSIAFGLLAVSAGLSSFQAVLFSMTSLTGAAQFLAINLVSSGAAMGEIITSVVLLNLRYFMMSASLAKKMGLQRILSKILLPAAVTDEVFSVAYFSRKVSSENYVYGLQSLSWTGWVTGTLTGVSVGNLLPKTLQEAVTIALFALFMALLVPEIKKTGRALLLSGAAGIMNSLFYYLFRMPPGWSIVLSMVSVSALGALIFGKLYEAENA